MESDTLLITETVHPETHEGSTCACAKFLAIQNNVRARKEKYYRNPNFSNQRVLKVINQAINFDNINAVQFQSLERHEKDATNNSALTYSEDHAQSTPIAEDSESTQLESALRDEDEDNEEHRTIKQSDGDDENSIDVPLSHENHVPTYIGNCFIIQSIATSDDSESTQQKDVRKMVSTNREQVTFEDDSFDIIVLPVDSVGAKTFSTTGDHQATSSSDRYSVIDQSSIDNDRHRIISQSKSESDNTTEESLVSEVNAATSFEEHVQTSPTMRFGKSTQQRKTTSNRRPINTHRPRRSRKNPKKRKKKRKSIDKKSGNTETIVDHSPVSSSNENIALTDPETEHSLQQNVTSNNSEQSTIVVVALPKQNSKKTKSSILSRFFSKPIERQRNSRNSNNKDDDEHRIINQGGSELNDIENSIDDSLSYENFVTTSFEDTSQSSPSVRHSKSTQQLKVAFTHQQSVNANELLFRRSRNNEKKVKKRRSKNRTNCITRGGGTFVREGKSYNDDNDDDDVHRSNNQESQSESESSDDENLLEEAQEESQSHVSLCHGILHT